MIRTTLVELDTATDTFAELFTLVNSIVQTYDSVTILGENEGNNGTLDINGPIKISSSHSLSTNRIDPALINTEIDITSSVLITSNQNTALTLNQEIPNNDLIIGLANSTITYWEILNENQMKDFVVSSAEGFSFKLQSNLAGLGLITGTNLSIDSALLDLDVSDIPDLPASKVTEGTFSVNRIPSLNASKTTTGTFDEARIPHNLTQPVSLTSTTSGGTPLEVHKDTNLVGYNSNIANFKGFSTDLTVKNISLSSIDIMTAGPTTKSTVRFSKNADGIGLFHKTLANGESITTDFDFPIVQVHSLIGEIDPFTGVERTAVTVNARSIFNDEIKAQNGITIEGAVLGSARASAQEAADAESSTKIMTPFATKEAIKERFSIEGSAKVYASRAFGNVINLDTSTPDIDTESKNIVTASKYGPGDYRVNFGIGMRSNKYAVQLTLDASQGATSLPENVYIYVHFKTNNYFEFRVKSIATNALVDVHAVSIAVFH